MEFMRTVCLTLVVLLCGVGVGSAQDSSNNAPDPAADPQTQPGLLQAPHIFTKGLDIATQLSGDYINAPPKDGFYPEFGNMVTGEGFISAGPGYRRHFFGDRAFVDGSAAVSVRSYKQAQVRFEAPS